MPEPLESKPHQKKGDDSQDVKSKEGQRNGNGHAGADNSQQNANSPVVADKLKLLQPFLKSDGQSSSVKDGSTATAKPEQKQSDGLPDITVIDGRQPNRDPTELRGVDFLKLRQERREGKPVRLLITPAGDPSDLEALIQREEELRNDPFGLRRLQGGQQGSSPISTHNIRGGYSYISVHPKPAVRHWTRLFSFNQ